MMLKGASHLATQDWQCKSGESLEHISNGRMRLEKATTIFVNVLKTLQRYNGPSYDMYRMIPRYHDSNYRNYSSCREFLQATDRINAKYRYQKPKVIKKVTDP